MGTYPDDAIPHQKSESKTLTMSQHKISWQHFPKHSPCPECLQQITRCFQTVADEISSLKNVGQNSNAVLAKVRDGLIKVGFNVESNKTAEGKIKVPVLYGPNGKVDKYFDADAYHPDNKVVLEVEAGRAVTNYQFLKDLFQACVMQDVDYAAIAVRQDYRGSKDFEKVVTFIETIFASNRLTLPLLGILIIGY
jgi:hypothetical protein